MARGAAERANAAELAEIDEIAKAMLAASHDADDIAFMRLDRELNILISQAARNEFAARSMSLMHGLSRRFWYQHYKEVADLPLPPGCMPKSPAPLPNATRPPPPRLPTA